MTFFADIHPTAWMATGYALFLLVSACGLEFLARNTHRRTLRLSRSALSIINTWMSGNALKASISYR